MPPPPIDRRLFLGLAAGALLPRAALAQPWSSPFRLVQGRVVVPVRIDGQATSAILDSGSTVMGLDRVTADRLGIRAQGARRRMRGVQHTLSGRFARVDSLEVANARMPGVEMLVLDYGDLVGPVGYAVEAALGADFFRRFVVELDFSKTTLRLHPRQGFAPPAASLVPLAERDGLMTAPVTLPGGIVQAVVDLASEPPLLVSPAVARRLKLLEGRPTSSAPLRGVGGQAIARIGSAPGVTLAGAGFEDVPVEVPPRSLGFDANLGLGLLCRFHLWLDFGGARMWLKPEGPQSAFDRNLLGAYGMPDGEALRITHVAPGSPAAAAGLRRGDRILEINGKPAVEANAALEAAPAGAEIAFTLAGGRTRRLTLRRYY